MTPPPVLPQSRPPVLASKPAKVPTFVYTTIFSLSLAIQVIWLFVSATTHVHSGSPDIKASYAFGVVLGGIIAPLILVAAIASIWKQNRSFRGMIRVLFWASSLFLVIRLNQFIIHATAVQYPR